MTRRLERRGRSRWEKTGNPRDGRLGQDRQSRLEGVSTAGSWTRWRPTTFQSGNLGTRPPPSSPRAAAEAPARRRRPREAPTAQTPVIARGTAAAATGTRQPGATVRPTPAPAGNLGVVGLVTAERSRSRGCPSPGTRRSRSRMRDEVSRSPGVSAMLPEHEEEPTDEEEEHSAEESQLSRSVSGPGSRLASPGRSQEEETQGLQEPDAEVDPRRGRRAA